MGAVLLAAACLVGRAAVCAAQAAPATSPGCLPFGPSAVPTPSVSRLASLLSEKQFNDLFPNRPPESVFTYTGLIEAAKLYPGFAGVGDTTTQLQELAAFLANASQETTGSWSSLPEPAIYQWGLYYADEIPFCEPSVTTRTPEQDDACARFCVQPTDYACKPTTPYGPYDPPYNPPFYQGRGPLQITYNYNYGPADIYNRPDLVATDPATTWKTGLWFWMTPQPPKPSNHDIMVGNWVPTDADKALGRYPGFGMVINVINGGLECGPNLPILSISSISQAGNTVTLTSADDIPASYQPTAGAPTYAQIAGVDPAGYNGIYRIDTYSTKQLTLTNSSFTDLKPGTDGTFTLSRPPTAVTKRNNRIANYVNYFTSKQWGFGVAPGPNVDCERMTSYQ
jgi:basic endochitinase B